MGKITIPDDLWEEDTEGVLLTWFFDDGDKVESGDIVAEVMVDKIQYEILAGDSGRLTQSVALDAPVNKGDVIGDVQ